jgi:RNA polymerase sigma factor (sigma-70 family)
LDTQDIAVLREQGLRLVRKRFPTLSHDEQEDVVQDSLIRLVRKAPDPALLNTIIDGVGKNLIRAKASRAVVEVAAGDSTDLSVMTGTRYTLDAAIFATDFNRALRGLPEDSRNAFILMELRGLTAYEAAQVLDIGVGTVYGRVEAAKAALRKEL